MTAKEKTRHGQAIALQYALQILLNATRDSRVVHLALSEAQLAAAGAVKTANLGCLYASRILSPFVVELALKALIARHNDDQVARYHELSQLYDDLPPRVQDELETEFDHIKQSELPAETGILKEILAEHNRDFTGWRYLDDPESLADGPIDILQYVACAVLNVYNAEVGPTHTHP
ncbi:MAG: hypothetical protein KTV45_15475 [Acidimicrobiia bacterium]|nr:hypothetical protein [Acidimicrobiia bacterium]